MLLFQSAVLLCKASKRGDLATIQVLLQVLGSAILEVKLPNRYADAAGTPLHFSVRHGNQAAVNLFLDQNPLLVNTLDDIGNTLLHWVALNENNDPGGMTTLLLSRGANLLTPGWGKITPLQQAVKHRNFPVAVALLRGFSDKNLLHGEVKAAIKFFDSLVAERYWNPVGQVVRTKAAAEIRQLLDSLEEKLTMSMGFASADLAAIAINEAVANGKDVLNRFKEALEDKTTNTKDFIPLFFEILDKSLVKKAADLVPSALLHYLPAHLRPKAGSSLIAGDSPADSKTGARASTFTIIRSFVLPQGPSLDVVKSQISALLHATPPDQMEAVGSELIAYVVDLTSAHRKSKTPSSPPLPRLQLTSSSSAASPASIDPAPATNSTTGRLSPTPKRS